MSAEIVNLRKARKDRARADKQRRADENSVKFGRSKSERRSITAERELANRKLDGMKRDRSDGDEE